MNLVLGVGMNSRHGYDCVHGLEYDCVHGFGYGLVTIVCMGMGMTVCMIVIGVRVI